MILLSNVKLSIYKSKTVKSALTKEQREQLYKEFGNENYIYFKISSSAKVKTKYEIGSLDTFLTNRNVLHLHELNLNALVSCRTIDEKNVCFIEEIFAP